MQPWGLSRYRRWLELREATMPPGWTGVDGHPRETFRAPPRLLAVPRGACRGGAATAAEGALWEAGSGAGPWVTAVRQRQAASGGGGKGRLGMCPREKRRRGAGESESRHLS